VIKYREQVIDNEISLRIKDIFMKIAEKYKIELKKWNHDKDHVHVLFTCRPEINMSKSIGTYKSLSSRIIKILYHKIRKKLWKEYF
jgi:putative transposase